ncbi:hypothetical protein XENTR_v10023498 [Xenopus tropicalis]|nr:hypothetical protein XENTR_v10023498 [Xenopus tropicalis]
MASNPLLMFLFIVGLAPQIFGADKIIECLLQNPVNGEFVPCGKNITVQMLPTYLARVYEHAALTIECKDSTPLKKMKFILDCCFSKDCTSIVKIKDMNVMMQCTEPKECNLPEAVKMMKMATCSLANCAFSKKVYPAYVKDHVMSPRN